MATPANRSDPPNPQPDNPNFKPTWEFDEESGRYFIEPWTRKADMTDNFVDYVAAIDDQDNYMVKLLDPETETWAYYPHFPMVEQFGPGAKATADGPTWMGTDQWFCIIEKPGVWVEEIDGKPRAFVIMTFFPRIGCHIWPPQPKEPARFIRSGL